MDTLTDLINVVESDNPVERAVQVVQKVHHLKIRNICVRKLNGRLQHSV